MQSVRFNLFFLIIFAVLALGGCQRCYKCYYLVGTFDCSKDNDTIHYNLFTKRNVEINISSMQAAGYHCDTLYFQYEFDPMLVGSTCGRTLYHKELELGDSCVIEI